MINTLKPSSTLGHDSERGQILERISKEYGPPEEKQREAVKKLGKDEFFKIMVTQIQHQDPLKPYQNEQMAAQMAQFSSLEQMVNMNQNLEKLTQSQTPMHQLGAAGLIGKFVTSDSSRVTHTDGSNNELHFELPVNVNEAKITIFNEKGEDIREITAKDLKQGAAKVIWDGKKSNSLSAATGNYRFAVSATSDTGKPIDVQTKNTSLVHGVTFDGKETVLLTGDIRNPQKVLLKSVARIVDPKVENVSSNSSQSLGSSGNNQEMSQSINAAAEADSPKVENLESKYSPINVNDLRKDWEKPEVKPTMSNQQIDQMIQDSKDLGGANPIGQALKNGDKITVDDGEAASDMPMVNPAAFERGMQALTQDQRQQYQQQTAAESVAETQNLPSSQDGSISGE